MPIEGPLAIPPLPHSLPSCAWVATERTYFQGRFLESNESKKGKRKKVDGFSSVANNFQVTLLSLAKKEEGGGAWRSLRDQHQRRARPSMRTNAYSDSDYMMSCDCEIVLDLINSIHLGDTRHSRNFQMNPKNRRRLSQRCQVHRGGDCMLHQDKISWWGELRCGGGNRAAVTESPFG